MDGYQREIHTRPIHSPASPVSKPSPAALAARLSRTERRILPYLGSGVTERQIAEVVARSPHTIHVHVKSIYRKLGIGSRRQLLDLLDPENTGTLGIAVNASAAAARNHAPREVPGARAGGAAAAPANREGEAARAFSIQM
jgi:DNA-binding CsgD family transcriptional regulator